MHGKIRFISVIFIATLSGTASVFAQADQQQANTITITSKVLDSDREPVEDAWIYGEGGSLRLKTGPDGSFTINVSPNSVLLIEKKGYNTIRLTAGQEEIPESITLESRPFQLAESDRVHLPFTSLPRRDIPGMIQTLDPDEIMKSDGTQDFYDALRGRIPGLFGTRDVYGLGEALLVIDGIPRPGQIQPFSDRIPDQVLNLQEVSQITVLKDLSSRILYGTQADMPVILVTTKQGEPHKRQMSARVESGIMNPVSFPRFLNAADYMTLYNEALQNDGKLPKYDEQSIENTRNGTNPLIYPDEDYYNSTYLNNSKPYFNLTAQASGGNDAATYYTFLGWNREYSLVSLGRDEFDDRINIRGNVGYNITDHIKMKFNGLAMFDVHKGPNGDFWGNSSTFLPNRSPVLVPVTDSDAVPSLSLINGNHVLGGTSEYRTNIYGDLVRAGYLNSYSRYLQVNTGFDFDLNTFIQGLTASANLTFDLFSFYRARQLNEYAIYEPVLMDGSQGDSIALVEHGRNVNVGSESVVNPHFFRKLGFFGKVNYDRVLQDDHEIHAVGVAYGDYFVSSETYTQFRYLHYGVQGNYSYKHKYAFQLGGVLAGSPAFSRENRWALSPAAGVSWIISEETFFPSSLFLKLKASAGRIHTDRGHHSEYYFRDNFIRGSTFYYRDQVSANQIAIIQSVANPDLEWAKRDQITAGFEAVLLNRALSLEGGYFYSRLSDVPTQRSGTYPDYVGVLPYENYNSYQDQGVEFGLRYTRSFGDFTLSVGGNYAYAVPRILQVDEPNYEFDYLKRTGKATDAIFGLVGEGFYSEDDFTGGNLNPGIPYPTFGDVQPGDLRYRDLNEDGRIDLNDEQVIGYHDAKMQYGLHMRLKYRTLELFILGTGQTGQSTLYNSPYYWVFGDRKYPELVMERWTPETASTAAYPRLSSTANANNFRSSTFWLYQEDWFTLHTMQLTLNLPYRMAAGSFLKDFQVYVRGSNLFTISENRERRELNVGTEPQFRAYSIGINASF